MTAKPIVAIFDLDRTITTSGTYTPALLGWALRHAPMRLLLAPVAALLMLGYVAKLMSRTTLKLWMLRLLMGRVRRATLEAFAETFARSTVPDRCNHDVLEEIRRLQSTGAAVGIATASFDWCARAIGRQLGIGAIIATRSVVAADGRLDFAIDGRNCYGMEKRRMIEAAFASAFGIERAQFFGRPLEL